VLVFFFFFLMNKLHVLVVDLVKLLKYICCECLFFYKIPIHLKLIFFCMLVCFFFFLNCPCINVSKEKLSSNNVAFVTNILFQKHLMWTVHASYLTDGKKSQIDHFHF